jgi:hypothetical protein
MPDQYPAFEVALSSYHRAIDKEHVAEGERERKEATS